MRQGLIACITCELLALAVWIGGLLVLVAAVIPAVFNTFGGQDTGGFFLTRAFDGYNRLVLGSAAILTSGVLWRGRAGPPGVGGGGVDTKQNGALLGRSLPPRGLSNVSLTPTGAPPRAPPFPPPTGRPRAPTMGPCPSTTSHPPTRGLV